MQHLSIPSTKSAASSKNDHHSLRAVGEWADITYEVMDTVRLAKFFNGLVWVRVRSKNWATCAVGTVKPNAAEASAALSYI